MTKISPLKSIKRVHSNQGNTAIGLFIIKLLMDSKVGCHS